MKYLTVNELIEQLIVVRDVGFGESPAVVDAHDPYRSRMCAIHSAGVVRAIPTQEAIKPYYRPCINASDQRDDQTDVVIIH